MQFAETKRDAALIARGRVFLDNAPFGGTVDDGFNPRASVGVSVFWTTPIGPLRFNFSRAVKKEDYDKEQSFDLTISTKF